VTPLAGHQILYTFEGGADGENPYAGLLAENGEFYGTTFGGGTGPSGGAGTAFKMSPSGTKTVLYNFQAGNDAGYPQAGLIAGSGGVLFGNTVYGGGATQCTSGCGTVFELTPSGSGYSERALYAFQGGSDGAIAVGSMMLDKSGALYGTTELGGGASACSNSGVTGCGTVFKLTPSGSGYTESILYSFQGGNDGIRPVGTLIADAHGALYGTTEYGGGVSACTSGSGNPGCGTVFKLTPSGSGYTETVLYRFQGGTTDGSVPRSGLLSGTGSNNRTLYGVTVRGGASSAGTVYRLTSSGFGRYTESVLYSFNGKSGYSPYNENGLYLGRCQSSRNARCLYGTTGFGGTGKCFCGTVFKLTLSGAEKVLYSFKGGRRSDGSDPRGSLVADAAGTLYGTTFGGGLRQGYGIIFKVSP
jgi:uncharacterized repeat protein (TIGR03803 family)